MEDSEILLQTIDSAAIVSKRIAQKSKEPIGLHDLYKQTVDMAEDISYHAIKGVFPEKLFKDRSPNETKAEADYIKANYKQHTLPVFVDYISTITRPFGDGNWSIDYKDDDQKFKVAEMTFKDYVEGDLPIYKSLESFVKFVLPTLKSKDANGFIGIRPYGIPTIEKDGILVPDESKLNSPGIYYYHSKNVIDYNDYFYMFLSDRKSVVEFAGKNQKTGLVFEVYTKNAVYFIEQTGKKTDHTFKAITYYVHELNEIPVTQLKGVPELVDGKILWQSPFLFVTHLLDLVTINLNWLQASVNKCVFPITVVFGTECDFKNELGQPCVAGTINVDGQAVKCRACNGTGLKSRLSPLGTLIIDTSNPEGNDMISKQDPVKFVSPSVDTLDFIKKLASEYETTARSILKLRNKNSSTNTNNDVTATEVFDDAKSMTAFVKPTSDQTFEIYEFCLNMIGKQRYGNSFVKPDLHYPKTFDFKTPEDYLTDLQNAMKTGLPPAFIQLLLIQYINSFYADGAITLSIFKIIIEADRLFGISDTEINIQLAKGLVQPWEKILHTSILTFINQEIADDTEFLNKDIQVQIENVQQAAKDLEAQNSQSTPNIFETPQPING